MDELSSTEFRKTFARLVRPTIVTVNGHPIGEWHPGRSLRVTSPDSQTATVGSGEMTSAWSRSRPVPKKRVG